MGLGNKKNVLVVDDVVVILMRVSQILSNEANIFGARSVSEALKIIDKQDIDLFILDINLPDASGISLLRYIRTFKRHTYTPVVILTGNASRTNVHAVAKAGVKRFLAKPFDSKQLLDVFRSCFMQGECK